MTEDKGKGKSASAAAEMPPGDTTRILELVNSDQRIEVPATSGDLMRLMVMLQSPQYWTDQTPMGKLALRVMSREHQSWQLQRDRSQGAPNSQ